MFVQDYTITIYLNQYWKDDRLSFSDDDQDNMTLTGDFTEKIWVPDTFFANDKLSFLHSVTEKNHMIRLYGDGSIVYGMRSVSRVAFFSIVCHPFCPDISGAGTGRQEQSYTLTKRTSLTE